MNPALMNDPGGPGMDFSGTWLNKKNNKTVTVRGNFFDGDRMFVTTTTGEQIDGSDFTNNYIQVGGTEKEIQETLKEITQKKKVDPMFEGLAELKKENDKKYGVSKPNKPIENSPVEYQATKINNIEENPADKILSQIFKKTDIKYNVNIIFSNWPKEPLKMAMEYLDVQESDIVQYVQNNIKFDQENLQKDIKEFLAD